MVLRSYGLGGNRRDHRNVGTNSVWGSFMIVRTKEPSCFSKILGCAGWILALLLCVLMLLVLAGSTTESAAYAMERPPNIAGHDGRGLPAVDRNICFATMLREQRRGYPEYIAQYLYPGGRITWDLSWQAIGCRSFNQTWPWLDISDYRLIPPLPGYEELHDLYPQWVYIDESWTYRMDRKPLWFHEIPLPKTSIVRVSNVQR